MGRDRDVCDLPFDHPSISKQHAVLQYRQISTKTLDGSYKNVIKLYIIDLESTHGTRLDGKRIEVGRYYELRDGDVIKLGESLRELVIMDAGMVEEID